MDLETLLSQVANYGFPMVLSWYLLVRMEGRLDRLTDSINSLAAVLRLEKQHKKRRSSGCAFLFYIIVYQASIPRPSASGSGP